MNKILAVDTSTKVANVTIKNNGFILDETINNEITHSEKLLPLIDKVLKEVGLNVSNLNVLACVLGPGSFTGIRIGIATIKAFANILKLPVFGVSSLELLAYKDFSDKPDLILALIDSRNNRAYYGLFEVEYIKHNNNIIPVIKNVVPLNNMPIEDILIFVNDVIKQKYNENSKLLITGELVEDLKEQINDVLTLSSLVIRNNSLSSNTLIEMYENYKSLDNLNNYMYNYLDLDALYVRPSSAERLKNNEQ
ncbi:MAG: tRNA (adenosine(37)-N6)-threonylcarbamoyltransferase complex dimerization subunit type 1 TsaB [Clostridia bacterium]|nr:tRNA (adenosine(37)-N6)-threonylcarbamoyltransferase complex dimerization subunit type 1 TsaB [Clostridia bacterium]MDD4375436.1 tRNA (adenosine(37)-N6)-threonylcarbamoyltransferase complex dimerization subunit type 1 TsaB [Clostridia bacterium]